MSSSWWPHYFHLLSLSLSLVLCAVLYENVITKMAEEGVREDSSTASPRTEFFSSVDKGGVLENLSRD